MEVKRKIKPGMPGTLRLVQEYGDKLICVRYRYDKIQHKRQTTVELLVDEQPWYGDINNVSKKRSLQADPVKVHVKILYNELELRSRVKNAGGIWDTEKRLWVVSKRQVAELGLQDRVVGK